VRGSAFSADPDVPSLGDADLDAIAGAQAETIRALYERVPSRSAAA
jgi:hypothetical protein